MEIESIINYLGYAGLFTVIYSIYKFFSYFLYNYYNPTQVSLWDHVGKWGLITGPTEGIGEAMTTELARCGINVILVGRNKEKLENVAESMEILYDVKTKIIEVDFLADDEEEYSMRIAKGIEGLEVAVLINNVGMTGDLAPFHAHEKGSIKTSADLIKCNINSVNNMLALITPQMLEREKGIIINMSSLSCKFPIAYNAVYSATKAYIHYLSLSLNYEYAMKGVTVQCYYPSRVVTRMNETFEPSQTVPTPDKYAAWAMNALGNYPASTGYIWHDLQEYLMDYVLPSWMTNSIIMDQSKEIIEKRKLKKK